MRVIVIYILPHKIILLWIKNTSFRLEKCIKIIKNTLSSRNVFQMEENFILIGENNDFWQCSSECVGEYVCIWLTKLTGANILEAFGRARDVAWAIAFVVRVKFTGLKYIVVGCVIAHVHTVLLRVVTIPQRPDPTEVFVIHVHYVRIRESTGREERPCVKRKFTFLINTRSWY